MHLLMTQLLTHVLHQKMITKTITMVTTRITLHSCGCIYRKAFQTFGEEPLELNSTEVYL